MNKWGIPLVSITIIIFGVLLFLSQSKSKEPPALPPVSEDTFQTISLTPAQGQSASQQQAQTKPQPTFGVEEGVKASYSAVIKTTKGNITVTLRGDQAPNTVKNFINKANSGFYKNLTFHRVEDWVIQGGDPKGTGAGGGEMQTEINSLPFAAGSLGIARRNDIRVSNDSQFFITKTDASWLDQQYTNFGNVTDGMNVVNNMKVGDKILSITVEE
jgi:peptidyl-prolyl cis-trans isomerase B (cyclophilin B)